MTIGTTIVDVHHPQRGYIHSGTIVAMTTHFAKVFNGKKIANNMYPDVTQNSSELYPIEWLKVVDEHRFPITIEPVLR